MFKPGKRCQYEPYYCISPNVGRYFSLVTGPPPPPAMEAMEAAMERFRRLLDAKIISASLLLGSVKSFYLAKKKNFFF